jgi:hypothetical protein
MTRLRVRGPDGLDLQWSRGGITWSWACSLPCEKELPIGVEYRIRGDSIYNSEPFKLSPIPIATTDLRVYPVPRWHHDLGIALLILGPLTLVPAAFVDAFLFVAPGESCPDFGCSNSLAGVVALGITLTGVGLAAIISGAVLVTEHTDVVQTSTPPAPRAELDGAGNARESDPWHTFPVGMRAPLLSGVF